MDSSSSMILSHLNRIRQLLNNYGVIYKLDVVNNLREMIRIHGILKGGKVVTALSIPNL